MPPRAIQFLVGQHPKRPYFNGVTKFFFTELDKGIGSPYILLASGVFFSYVAWRITDYYIAPRQEELAQRRPIQRVPFVPSHNAFWGFNNVEDRHAAAAAAEHGNSGNADMENVASNLYLPQSTNAEQEEAFRRPQLLYSEASELLEQPSPANPTGEVDVVCLELSEYDPPLHDDVYYRSVHYVPSMTEAGAAALASASSSHSHANTAAAKQQQRSLGSLWRRATGAADPTDEKHGSKQPPSASSSPPISTGAGNGSATASGDGTPEYLHFMPGKGEEVVHGMIKCKGITTQNNCVPFAGHLEEEYVRKMMLTLGPVHILRDAVKTTIPLRFTYVKQVPVETLVLGMHSGEMPRWLSTCYPNFHVNVVEKDGTLVRLCKRFLGFQESSNLTVEVGDPVEYVKQRSVLTQHGPRERVTPFDLVLVDGMDGAGKLSTQYGRLEFIHNVRNVMSNNGCVALTLPNKDAGFVFNMVQNWRMAFAGRPVVLIHCVTAPCTILMTFQDVATRGKANIGSVANVDEFQDLLRAHMRHYGADRMQFDITREVDARNFRVLNPEQSYGIEAYLPVGHPAALTAAQEAMHGATQHKRKSEGWNAWLRRWSGLGLTPGQRADLKEAKHAA